MFSVWRVRIGQRAILPPRMLDIDQTHQEVPEVLLGLNHIPKVCIIVPCHLVLGQYVRLVHGIDRLQWIAKVPTIRALAKGRSARKATKVQM